MSYLREAKLFKRPRSPFLICKCIRRETRASPLAWQRELASFEATVSAVDAGIYIVSASVNAPRVQKWQRQPNVSRLTFGCLAHTNAS